MALARTARQRPLAFAALLTTVALAHALLGSWLLDSLPQVGEGAARQGPPRLKAQFVAELRPMAPPPLAAAPAAPPARRPAAAAAPAATASAPLPAASAPAASAPAADAEAPALAAEPAAETAAAASASASAPALASEAVPPPFEWPRSTRLSYRLSGHFRGPIDGQASVEWLREGSRYQVHLEVSVGPPFAPLLSRRMSSTGEIGPEGLLPRRYDEETRTALRPSRRLTMLFGDATVLLPSGIGLPRPPGVQDTASQFVQLTWLFTTQPQRLRAGESVALMLALPRRVDAWVYDVQAPETLDTVVGPIEAVHVRPRRPARPQGELAAEMWVAPSLQYLPVRIVIRQDADTFVDLLLERLPLQAAEGGPR